MSSDKNKLFDDGKSRFVVEEAYNNVHMRLVRGKSELRNKEHVQEFNPEFCHQHFGENETLYGYVNPKIDLWFGASDLMPYFNFTYDEKIDNADNVCDLVKQFLPETGYKTSLDAFAAHLDKSTKFEPPATLIHSFSLPSKPGCKFGVYKIEDLHNETWLTLRERIESFSYWFIDAATYTDSSDDKWNHYIMYEEYKESDGHVGYSFMGYAALYWYYAYNNMYRPRVGHILILPPYQKQGHGAVLLQTIYNDLIPNPAVKDITAEDPAEGFVRLRDYVNACNCSSMPCMQGNNVKKDLNKQMINLVATRLKLPKLQIVRAYEILRLQAIDTKGDEVLAFKTYVQSRLNKKYQKRKSVARIIEHLKPEEIEEMQKSEVLSEEQRILTVSSEYETLIGEYRSVIDRMGTHPPSQLPPLAPPSNLSPPFPPTPDWLKMDIKNKEIPESNHNGHHKYQNGEAHQNGVKK